MLVIVRFLQYVPRRRRAFPHRGQVLSNTETTALLTGATTWLRTTAHRLLHQNTSPAGLGVATGVGVLFACTPFFGLQLAIALAIAWLLKLNKVAVAIGTQFSIPPMIPFIVFASAWTGEWIVHRRAFSLSLAELRSATIPELAAQIGIAWLVGGTVVGLVSGSIVGTIVFLVARRRAQKASPSEVPSLPSGPAAG